MKSWAKIAMVAVLLSTLSYAWPQQGKGGGGQRPTMRGGQGDPRMGRQGPPVGGPGVGQPPMGTPPAQRQPRRSQQDRTVTTVPGDSYPDPQHRQRRLGDWLRGYEKMTPDQQQKALENDAQFKQLPPRQQEHLRQRLNQFNSMTPEQRARLIERLDSWSHLTPEQQESARGMWGQMRGLAPERRMAVRRAFNRLRQMDVDGQQRIFASDRFKSMFSADEQQLVRGLLELAPKRDVADDDDEGPPQ